MQRERERERERKDGRHFGDGDSSCSGYVGNGPQSMEKDSRD